MAEKLRKVDEGKDRLHVPELRDHVMEHPGLHFHFNPDLIIGLRGASRFEFLLSEQRDAEIDAGDFEIWVAGQGLFEQFLRVGGALLVHVGDAECVEAIRLSRVVVRRCLLRWRGWRLRRARMKKRSSAKRRETNRKRDSRTPKASLH